MTYARSLLIPPGSAGTFHCVSRCVRRAFLCGEDRLTGRSFEHRRQWVEDRIHFLAEVFGVAIWGYAVMSNHLHVVVQTLPEAVAAWSDAEVTGRWVRLFPREDLSPEWRAGLLASNPEKLAVLRSRLADLSWFMRCLSEPIARAANREDICKGRFWEGRYKVQVLLDEAAVLSAMTYVDLNPIRAGLCETLETSDHTSAQKRLKAIEAEPEHAKAALAPIAGIRGLCVLSMTQVDYLRLVDASGRQVREGKRGAIRGAMPAILQRFGVEGERWVAQVLAVRSGYSRAIGSAERMVGQAQALGQGWMRGIGVARRFAAGGQ